MSGRSEKAQAELRRVHLEAGVQVTDHVYLASYHGGERPLFVKAVDRVKGVVDLRIRYGTKTHYRRDLAEFIDYDAGRGGWRLAK